MSLQKRLQKILEDKNLNASAFARSIDVKKSNLSHIISGRNKPSTDFFIKINNTYPEIDLNWLITGKKIKKDASVVFIHSGGLPNVFTYNDEYIKN